MTIQTQNRQAKINESEAERAFFYNVILPDTTILIMGLIISFGTLLNLFS